MNPVIVMNDWLGDTSSWDAARPYLDEERFSWAFHDLRGYGAARGKGGPYTVEANAEDVLALADARGWDRFAVVGHSMSCLVALHLAQTSPARVTHAVLVTPPPPFGFGADDAGLEVSRALARGDEATKRVALERRFGDRLARKWAAFKAERWAATSDPKAAEAYVAMFGRDGLPDRTTKIGVPVLALSGELDFEPMRSAGAERALSPLCEKLTVVGIGDSGHYPMQETPPLFVAHVERFLSGLVVPRRNAEFRG